MTVKKSVSYSKKLLILREGPYFSRISVLKKHLYEIIDKIIAQFLCKSVNIRNNYRLTRFINRVIHRLFHRIVDEALLLFIP